MGANGASGQELQIAPKNRFRADFFEKIMDLSLLIFHPIFITVLYEMY